MHNRLELGIHNTENWNNKCPFIFYGWGKWRKRQESFVAAELNNADDSLAAWWMIVNQAECNHTSGKMRVGGVIVAGGGV